MTDKRRVMKDRLDVIEHVGVVVTRDHGLILVITQTPG
jgi:hypothetical protein